MGLEEDITSDLLNYIAKNLTSRKVPIKRESKLYEDLGADSLDILEMQLHLEEKYKIEIKDEEAVILRTVGDVVDYVKKNYK